MRRSTLLTVIVSGALALAAPAIANADPGATVTRDVNQTILYTNPCTGVTDELTLTYTMITNGVNEEGPPGIHAIQTLVGDFTFADGTTGHFTTHSSFEASNGPLVIPLTVEAHGTTADGSQFSLHFVTLSLGVPPEVTLSFEHCA
jgi:hypothetical protein